LSFGPGVSNASREHARPPPQEQSAQNSYNTGAQENALPGTPFCHGTAEEPESEPAETAGDGYLLHGAVNLQGV
jgi:hypothetical protein